MAVPTIEKPENPTVSKEYGGPGTAQGSSLLRVVESDLCHQCLGGLRAEVGLSTYAVAPLRLPAWPLPGSSNLFLVVWLP